MHLVKCGLTLAHPHVMIPRSAHALIGYDEQDWMRRQVEQQQAG